MEFSKFTPYLIPTQKLKVEKFERGLNARIKDALLASKIRKFVDLEDRAVILEDNFHDKMEEFYQRNRSFQSSNQSKGKRPMHSNTLITPRPILTARPHH